MAVSFLLLVEGIDLVAPTAWLDGKHTIFGRVSQGMSTLKRIGLSSVDANDKPTRDVMIYKATVEE